MAIIVPSIGLRGMEGYRVQVEVQLIPGVESVHIVGLPDASVVTISRAASVTYPAQFLLIGAMNPCPCGYLGSRYQYWTCSPKQVTAYNNRVSGPIQDRMDMLLKLDKVTLDGNVLNQNETSDDIRKRVIQARKKQ